ncbi:unnamed protein product [Blepharisma stoltei]|uniref:RanBP-type and C3HC4-type zinc finger-containing protein 1 n=1 Tax=Blepharisma stoltei TaxID=1481888 RepID=A0AAU9K410_9CILI|nr:unnamed protein product [Blepharisma stoltei]
MECPECLNTWNSEEIIPRILNCGHSLCDPCAHRLFSISQLICPTCNSPNVFTIERQYNDTDISYANKCINTMPKNFSLLSLVCSRPSINPGFSPARKVKTFAHEITFGQHCEEHDLPIHSYTEKPYSLLCDECLEEIADLGLIIKPLPEIVNFMRDSLEEALTNITKKKSDLNRMKMNLGRLGSDESQKSIEKLEEHFQMLKKSLQKIYNDAKTNLNQMLQQQQEEAEFKLTSLETIQGSLREFEARLLDLESLKDEQIVSWAEEIPKILAEISIPSPEISPDINILTLSINRACYESLKDVIAQSYEIHVEEKQSENWDCHSCNSKNIDGEIQCFNCKSFRKIETYPNFLKNPNNVTEKELNEIQLRRNTELEMISELDNESGNTGVWYIINAEWIAEWKSFIFNKPSPNMAQNSPNKEIGTLPPGKISNDSLFLDPATMQQLKLKLKPVAHYRGVNEKVWQAYYTIYGGGPAIARKKLNIYDEPVEIPK